MSIFCKKQEQEIIILEKQLIIEKDKNDRLQASLTSKTNQLTKCISDKKLMEHYSNTYSDLPTMKEMLRSGKALETDIVSFKNQIIKQFNMGITSDSVPELGKSQIQFLSLGYYTKRIPWNVFSQILQKSPTNLFTYTTDGNRKYICNDFALGLYSELNLGPYWDMCFGIVTVMNHRLNLIQFSDNDNIYYVEPQTDEIWLPDLQVEDGRWIPRQIIM